ncbi:MAG TPA: hypothetical protein VGB20_06910 [bacterium]
MALRRVIPSVLAFLLVFAVLAPDAHANIFRGLGYLIAGILQLPVSTLAGTLGGPPVIGTVAGALGGAVRGVGLIGRGAFEIAGDAVGLAMRYGPLVPLFL